MEDKEELTIKMNVYIFIGTYKSFQVLVEFLAESIKRG